MALCVYTVVNKMWAAEDFITVGIKADEKIFSDDKNFKPKSLYKIKRCRCHAFVVSNISISTTSIFWWSRKYLFFPADKVKIIST